MASAWVPALACGLAARGHEITVAVDGVEDPAVFANVRLIVRRAHRTVRGSTPLSFQRWALNVLRTSHCDASLSLTTLVPAGVWAPVGGSFLGSFISMTRSHSGISSVLEALARPWLPAAVYAEKRAEFLARDMGSVRCRIGALTGPAGEHPLGYASTAEHWPGVAEANIEPGAPEAALVRAAARRALGIAGDRPVLVLSAVHPHRAGIGSFLGAIELLRRERGDRGPLVLVLGRKPYSVERAARKHGGLESLRFVGATSQIPTVMLGSDAAVSPWAHPRAAGTGRFIADALRFGLPVIAHAKASGAELIVPEHFGTPEIGSLVTEDSVGAWRNAVCEAIDALPPGQTSRAARDVSRALSLDALCARVEGMLRESYGHGTANRRP